MSNKYYRLVLQIQPTIWNKEGNLELSKLEKSTAEGHLGRSLKNSKSELGRGSMEEILGSYNNTRGGKEAWNNRNVLGTAVVGLNRPMASASPWQKMK